MNKILPSLMVGASVVFGAAASEPQECRSSLTVDDVGRALGKEVRLQPVFSGGGLKGWRVHGAERSTQQSVHSIAAGTLVTHVCGVPARQIFERKGDICCATDTSREFELRVRAAGKETSLLIKRAP